MIDEKATKELFETLKISTEYERQQYLHFDKKYPIKHEDHFVLLDNVSHTD
jgi:hypothetical protein